MEQICAAAFETFAESMQVARMAILLLDGQDHMRVEASRGVVTDDIRVTVKGDVVEGPADFLCLPLIVSGRLSGACLVGCEPVPPSAADLQMTELLVGQIAGALECHHLTAQTRRSEQQLRYALDAADMGTWDWDIASNRVVWSDNLATLHGLPEGTFDGSFASYEREIHPEDRPRVMASAERAIREGTPHEVEYRIVAPDGTVRWVEGKGAAEFKNGVAVRMTGICMMVTRRKEAELARLAVAEEASRLKDEFLATLSHELRTPLNAMLGWVQMLQAGGLTPERTVQAIDVIGRNATLQAQLIEDILDLSRIITGKLDIDRLPIVLPELVDLVVEGQLPAAEAKSIVLTRDVECELPVIEGDPKRLLQVMGNVLSNAIKFTPVNGTVTITCSVSDNRVEIRVTDSGTGIAPGFLPYVFDRFRQADSRSTRRHGGLGLGLAISRHLVELHGGSINIHSDGQDRGTTVTLRLPVPSARSRPLPRHTTISAAELRLDGCVVLLVDDQRDALDMLGVMLEDRGAITVLCGDAASALMALDQHAVGLLVADIAMPDVNGCDLIRQVRQRGSAVPAVAVSAYARVEDRSAALAAGFDAYCAKPIDAAHLFQIIRDVLAGRAQAPMSK
jgi:PAS domain S-box-containing protein